MTLSGSVVESKAPAAFSFLKLAGPGLIVAASGIGSGDVVSATVGGANYGVVLLWAIAVGAFFKFVLNEGIARFQLATEVCHPCRHAVEAAVHPVHEHSHQRLTYPESVR